MRRRSYYCRACHKTSFESEGIAERVIDNIHARGARKGGPSRVYPCPYNNGWHLTSQEKRT